MERIVYSKLWKLIPYANYPSFPFVFRQYRELMYPKKPVRAPATILA